LRRTRVVVLTVLVALAPSAAQAAGDGPASRAGTSCRALVHRGVLPAWARTGFSAPRPRLPHVLGQHGRIAALLFGDPLRSPPTRDSSNKILWVSRLPLRAVSDLRIHAQRMTGARRVGSPVRRVVVGAPGPSGIDLPHPGCWRLTLRWSGHVDRVDLRYR
jgi:hypothetical protein